MAVNLSRNTKVLFSTVTGATALAQFTAANTFEIQVLDGYTFTQNTEQQTIQLSEAGTSPIRGERAFNSKLNPVDWSFGTYIRPYKATNVKAPESRLWNAMFGYNDIDTTSKTASTATVQGSTATGWLATVTATAAHGLAVGDAVKFTGLTCAQLPNNGNNPYRVVSTATTAVMQVDLDYIGTTQPTFTGTASWVKGQWYESTTNAITTVQGSNVNKLQPFSLVFIVDQAVYVVDNCAVNQAEITFDLNGISMINWSGFGTTLTDRTSWGTPVAATNYTAFTTLNLTGKSFITNKLSTTTVAANLGGAGTSYTIPITGGNLTINNNIEYLTPEVLGTVNTSIGYFTGSRSITGSLNAYLKTGTNESSTLMANILTGLASTSETKFKLQIEIGGVSNATRVEALMNYCQLQVPTVDVQDVISTTINFTAQGGRGYTSASAFDQDYDIEATNNLQITYYGENP